MKHTILFISSMFVGMIYSHGQQKQDAVDSIKQSINSSLYSLYKPLILDEPTDAGFEKLAQEAALQYGKSGEQQVSNLIAFRYYMQFKSANGSGKDFNNWMHWKIQINKRHPDFTSLFDLNNDAWLVFETTSDKNYLQEALSWSKKVIDREPTANYYDTYANLLYKIGDRKEAVAIEEKALMLDPGNGPIESVRENLKKMRAGIPTWPSDSK